MTEQKHKRSNTNPEEVTFRDLVLKTKEYFFELVHNWKWILFAGLSIMIILGVRSSMKSPVYKARLSFMINQDNGNPFGAISGVLGNFGISTKGKNNLSKVLELSRSRRIIEKTLFDSVRLQGNNDFVVNHFIKYLDSIGSWNHKPWYSFNSSMDSLPMRFEKAPDKKTSVSEKERIALKALFNKIAGNQESGSTGLMESDYNEDSRILYLSTKTKDPELSIHLTNIIFDNLSKFYIDKSIEKQQSTYDILKSKSDSIHFVLKTKEQQVASLEDSWMGRYSSKSKLQERRLEKEIRLLNITLAESIKNLEIADFAVRNTMPYVQIIDRPVAPLEGIKPSLLKNIIIGFFIGALMAAFIIMIRKVFKDAMKN